MIYILVVTDTTFNIIGCLSPPYVYMCTCKNTIITTKVNYNLYTSLLLVCILVQVWIHINPYLLPYVDLLVSHQWISQQQREEWNMYTCIASTSIVCIFIMPHTTHNYIPDKWSMHSLQQAVNNGWKTKSLHCAQVLSLPLMCCYTL